MPVEKWTPERRRELTRTALVEAAAQVFARRGFHGASLDEIAETAGFTRGAIYKNFGGKEDLFFAVFDRSIEFALAAFSEQLEGGSAVADFDVSKLSSIWQQVRARDPDMFAMELEFRLYAIRNPEVRERFVAHQKKMRGVVARFIEEQAESAGLSLSTSAENLAAIVEAASQGFLEAAYLDPAEDNLFESFLAMIMPAIVGGAADVPAAAKAPMRRARTRAPKR